MFSINKKRDKEEMLEIAGDIEMLAKIGTTQALDLAEKFGEMYLRYEEKIKTHDYTEEDKRTEAIEAIFKK